MNDKPVALVTGANQGIGLQIAKDLVGQGFTVLVGARNIEKGDEAAKGIGPDARGIQLDVTKQVSIDAAAARIRKDFGRLDVLVNNAAISHAGKPGRTLAETLHSGLGSVVSIEELRTVYETNVFGVVAVTQAVLPLLREAPAGRIVNVSSAMGSLAKVSDPANPYRGHTGVLYGTTKTALNAITVTFALELESTRIKVNAACPGFTSTALNNFEGTRTVEQGAREPVRLALLDANGPTGTFSNDEGPLPW